MTRQCGFRRFLEMRYPLLLGLACLFAYASSAAVDTSGKNLTEILSEIRGVEDRLKEKVYEDYLEAQKYKQDLAEAAADKFSEGIENAKAKFAEAVDKFQRLRKEAEEKLAAEKQREKEEYYTELAEERKAKEAKRQAAKDRFEAFVDKVKTDLINKKKDFEAKKQQLADYLKEVNATIAENQLTRRDEKAQRYADRIQQAADFVKQFDAQRAALNKERQSLQDQLDAYEDREKALRDSIKDALREKTKEDYAEEIEDYLQDKLEKEVIARGIENILNPPDATVKPAPKASLVDTLTGKSAWETVAWILMAICIVLAVALIALVIYQVVSRNKYERLDGNNHGHGGGDDEHAALLGPKKGAEPRKQSQPSAPSAPPSHADPVPASPGGLAPTIQVQSNPPEHEQEQQF